MPVFTVTVVPSAASGAPMASQSGDGLNSTDYKNIAIVLGIVWGLILLLCCCVGITGARSPRDVAARAAASSEPCASVPRQEGPGQSEQNADTGTSGEGNTMTLPTDPMKADSKSESGWVNVGDGGESVVTDPVPPYPGPSETEPPSPPPTSPVAARTPQGAEPMTTPNVNEVNSQLAGNVVARDLEPEVLGEAKVKGHH
ncbi:hypothetical protein JVU11DRAFT_7344 [Chiua virens]|nr:hypothetical protein JVU11DRAFT_7344 [Chiua virens]